MALRLRRGTNAERQLITPLEGEPIFTTDTKDLYIGDGSTAGGIKVGGDIPTSINDLTDVNTSGISVGQVLKWNGTQFVAGDDNNDGTGPVSGGITEGQIYNISISGNDSSLIVDANTNTLRGVFEGVAYADLIGSVFSDNDSSVILDSTNRILSINDIEFTSLNPTITAPNNINITAPGGVGIENVQFNTGSQVEPINDNEGFIGSFAKRFAEGHFNELYADRAEGNWQGTFSGDDSTILVDGLTGEHFGTFIGNLIGNVIGNVDGNLSGTVRGNLVGDTKGSVFGDDSTILIDGQTSLVRANVVNQSVFTNSLDVVREGNDISVARLFSNTTGGANDFEFNSHRGTYEFPTDVSLGDGVMDITAKAYHSGDYRALGLMRFRTDAGGSFDNPTSGLPGSILFSVFNSNGGQTLQGTMELTQRGLVVNTFADYGPEALKVGGDAKITGTITAPEFVGDVKGSIFGDDSTVLVDAVNNTIPGYVSIAELKTALNDGAGDYAAFKAWVLANL